MQWTGSYLVGTKCAGERTPRSPFISGNIRGFAIGSRDLRPKGYWSVLENQKTFLDDLGKQLGFKQNEDWYQITDALLLNNGGGNLLARYNGSPIRTVQTVYHDHTWDLKRFGTVLTRYFDSQEHQRLFLDWLVKQLGFSNLDRLMTVTKREVEEHGGASLLDRYGNSVQKMVQGVYPDHRFAAAKEKKEEEKKEIRHVPRGYWDNAENVVQFVWWLSKELRVKSLEDWYRVSLAQIRHIAPTTLFKKKSLFHVLLEVFPGHTWDKDRFNVGGPMKASQRMLALLVQELFPHSEVKEDFLHKDILFKSGNLMELDVFLPKEKIALEYQGEHHYHDIYAFGPQWQYKERDHEKKIACKQKGITMIEIPYWWDRQKESLQATIHQLRPDVLAAPPGGEKPIPSVSPKTKVEGYLNTLMHGEKWDGVQELTGWWISEKLDGVRAYWDGHKIQSKQGNEIRCPQSLKDLLPSTPLDGELWLGRGRFSQLNGYLQSRQINDLWKDIKYMIFDLPGSAKPFEMRMEELKQISLPPNVELVGYEQCKGVKHLEEQLASILKLGGEGLMVIQPFSLYAPGRTSSLLKVKHFDDAEVLLVETLPTGLKCKQPNGLECIVTCFQSVLENPPKAGSVVTVKHTGYHSTGTIKFPYFWRERRDISWEEVVRQAQLEQGTSLDPDNDSESILKKGMQDRGCLATQRNGE